MVASSFVAWKGYREPRAGRGLKAPAGTRQILRTTKERRKAKTERSVVFAALVALGVHALAGAETALGGEAFLVGIEVRTTLGGTPPACCLEECVRLLACQLAVADALGQIGFALDWIEVNREPRIGIVGNEGFFAVTHTVLPSLRSGGHQHYTPPHHIG